MNVTPAPLSAQGPLTFHGEVVGVTAMTLRNPPTYRHEIAAKDATLYVTLPEALALWTPVDIAVTVAPEEAAT